MSGKSDDKFVVKVLDKIIAASIFMIFFGLPLFFTNLTFQGISFEKQIYFYLWLFLGLVAWTAKGVIIGEMNIKRTAFIASWFAVMSRIFPIRCTTMNMTWRFR